MKEIKDRGDEGRGRSGRKGIEKKEMEKCSGVENKCTEIRIQLGIYICLSVSLQSKDKTRPLMEDSYKYFYLTKRVL